MSADTTATSKHFENLQKICRLCGNYLGKDPFSVIRHVDKIIEIFFIDISTDDMEIHPQRFCMRFYTIMRHVKDRETTTSLFTPEWKSHSNQCTICTQNPKGGRRQKKKKFWTTTTKTG